MKKFLALLFLLASLPAYAQMGGTAQSITLLKIPSGAGQNGANSCAGYGTTLQCALAIGYSDPRVNYDPINNTYTPAKCNSTDSSHTTDDAPGFQNAAKFTRLPVLDPSNGSAVANVGGTTRCTWKTPITQQVDNMSIFHFPVSPVYNDLVDQSSLYVTSGGISQQNMVTTTITTTSGSNTATVGSCSGITAAAGQSNAFGAAATGVPAGATVTSCTGTTVTLSANATASGTGQFYVTFPRVSPYNCVWNIHGHTNTSAAYNNIRGDGIGGFFDSVGPFGGTVFYCDDVNTGTQALPLVNNDHASIRGFGNVMGASINIGTGLPTGTLGNNVLELRVNNSKYNNVGYVTNGNTPDLMIMGSEITAGCSAFYGAANTKITDNRIEFGGGGGGSCFGITTNRYSAIVFGTNFTVGGAVNLVVGNQFQSNFGPAIQFSGFHGAPAVQSTLITGNNFSQDAFSNLAGLDAEIVFNNLIDAAGTKNVTITGNTVQAQSGNTSPNYFVGFYGTAEDNIAVIGNTLGANAYKLAPFNFSTETPVHMKVQGNSGIDDFVLGYNSAFCKTSAALGVLDLQSCATPMYIPTFTTASRPACTSGLDGGFYNDSTLHVFEYCNGSVPAWQAVGAGAVSITSLSPGLIASPSPITGTGTFTLSELLNPQAAAGSYTVVAADMGKTVTHTASSAMADTLPQAGTTGFALGAAYTETNNGTGTLTITTTTSSFSNTGTTSFKLYQNESAYIASDGTNWIVTALVRNAEQTISFQPGLLTAVTNTKSVFGKFVKSSTVDNIGASALLFSCVSNPTITLYECGTSATCSSSPVSIGSATVTAAGTVVDGTISSAAITAGDYVAWEISAGTCTSLDISATAQVHSN